MSRPCRCSGTLRATHPRRRAPAAIASQQSDRPQQQRRWVPLPIDPTHWPSAATPATRRRLLAATALAPCGCAACAAAAKAAEQQQRPRNTALDRAFAAAMAEGMADYEASIAPVKRRLFSELLSSLPTAESEQPAQLLELGVGTGPNLSYYADFYGLASRNVNAGGGSNSGSRSSSSSSRPSSSTGGSTYAASSPPVHITGVDPNQFMRPYLEENLRRTSWPVDRFSWVQGQAEALPLADASMDAVVCTLVLCSVDDVAAAVQEAGRVLKPGGALLFIEHTTAQGQPLLWAAQCLFNPLQRLLADNCHLTRDPLPLIKAEPAFAGGVEGMRFSVDGASLIAPHVAGIARRSLNA